MRLVESTRKVADSADQADKKLGGMKGQLVGFQGVVGGIVAAGAVQRLSESLVDVGRAGLEFDRAFAEAQTILPQAGVDIAAIRSDIQGLAPNLGTATENTRALYQALSAGVEPAKAVGFVTEAAKLATASVTDTETAVDALTTILNAYGLEAEQSGRISDILFTTVREGKTTMDELGPSIGKVIPQAASLGVNFEEVAAAVGTLTKGGIRTTEAVTFLRQALVSLQKPSKEAQDLAASLGIEFDSNLVKTRGLQGALQFLREEVGDNDEALVTLFGSVEAGTAVLSLSGQQADEFARQVESMGGAAGATQTAYETMADSISNRTDALQNQIENLKVAMFEFASEGEGAGTVVTNLTDFLGLMTAAFQDAASGADTLGAKLVDNFPLLPFVNAERIRAFSDAIRGASIIYGQFGDEAEEVNEALAVQQVKMGDSITPLEAIIRQRERDAEIAREEAEANQRLKDALDKLPPAIDPVLARLQQLIEKGAGVLTEFEDIEGLSIDWAKLSPPSDAPPLIDTLARSMERYGVQIPDVNREMAQLENLWRSGQVPAKQMAAILEQQRDRFAELGVLTPEMKAKLDAWADSTGHASRETVDWNNSLGRLFDTINTGNQLLDNLISSIGNFIGSLLSGQGPLAAFQNSLAGIGGVLGSLGGTGGGIAGNILGALGSGGPLAGLFGGGATIAGGVGITGAIPAATSAAGLVGGGAAAGGAGGLGGLGALTGLLTNPLTGIFAGGALGAFGLFKLLTKSREEARTERQTSIFGSFQVPDSVIDSLTQLSIEATNANRKLPDTIASIVGFDEVLAAVGIRTQDQFAFAMQKGDEAVQRMREGLISGAEAADFFGNDSLRIMQEAAELLGESAVAEFQAMIDKAIEAGIIIPEEFRKAFEDSTTAAADELDAQRQVIESKQRELMDRLSGARGTERIEIERMLEQLKIQMAVFEQEAARTMQNTVDNAVTAGASIARNLGGGFGGPVVGGPGRNVLPGSGRIVLEVRGDGESRLMDEIARSMNVRDDRGRVAGGVR